jgi:CRISPR/Cas system-associated exonuclease Cas4 (RecB family)
VVPDLITRRDDGTLKVTEIKTSSRAYSEFEIATSLQPTCYAAALCERTGEEPVVELTVLVKTRTPKVQRIEAVRTIADCGRLGDLVEVVERAVEAGIFYPQESPLNCSTCPFFRECREWTGPGTSRSGDSPVHLIEEACPC